MKVTAFLLESIVYRNFSTFLNVKGFLIYGTYIYVANLKGSAEKKGTTSLSTNAPNPS